MNGKELKMRLLKLDKRQKDLLLEVRKRGYPTLAHSALNAYINAALITPKSEAVLKVCEQILKDWETAR